MDIFIREMNIEDWKYVAEIYHQGIRTGNATFEANVPTYSNWDSSHKKDCRLVAVKDDKIAAWAALSPTSARCTYDGVAEVSLYVHENYRGQSIGQTLLKFLIKKSEAHGYWTLQSGIFQENTTSINMHLKHGFKLVGLRERLGRDERGAWRNVLLLERRSETVGLN